MLLSSNKPLYEGTYLSSGLSRLFSYKHQIEIALSFSPQRASIIGIGDNIVGDILRSAGIQVFGIDIDENIKPDICSSVTHLAIHDNAVDITLCCQVLEHLPFNLFVASLKELRRISRKYLVISLPDIRRF